MSKILLIEDSEAIILGLEYLFKEEKFNFDFAKTKLDAMRKIEELSYDLILLDITLPDGDGFEIAKIIKEKIDTPIIFLTAKDEEKDVVYGLDLGAEDYIIKPFRNRELISRIRNVLRRTEKMILLNVKG